MENGLGVGVYVYTIVITNMRDKHYKIRCIRVDDELWELFKKKRKSSGKSCNQFIKELLDKIC